MCDHAHRPTGVPRLLQRVVGRPARRRPPPFVPSRFKRAPASLPFRGGWSIPPSDGLRQGLRPTSAFREEVWRTSVEARPALEHHRLWRQSDQSPCGDGHAWAANLCQCSVPATATDLPIESARERASGRAEGSASALPGSFLSGIPGASAPTDRSRLFLMAISKS